MPAFKALGNQVEVNMSPQKAGLYRLRVQTGNSFNQFKFLKNINLSSLLLSKLFQFNAAGQKTVQN